MNFQRFDVAMPGGIQVATRKYGTAALPDEAAFAGVVVVGFRQRTLVSDAQP
jgi:hypothetical protein